MSLPWVSIIITVMMSIRDKFQEFSCKSEAVAGCMEKVVDKKDTSDVDRKKMYIVILKSILLGKSHAIHGMLQHKAVEVQLVSFCNRLTKLKGFEVLPLYP